MIYLLRETARFDLQLVRNTRRGSRAIYRGNCAASAQTSLARCCCCLPPGCITRATAPAHAQGLRRAIHSSCPAAIAGLPGVSLPLQLLCTSEAPVEHVEDHPSGREIR